MEVLVQIFILSVAVIHCAGSSFEATSEKSISDATITSEKSVRIAGGRTVKHGEIPYLLAMSRKIGNKYYFICGASIISDRWALTAAHCVYGHSPGNILLHAGDHDLYTYEGTEVFIRVSKVLIQGGYRGNNYQETKLYHDIALLKFSQPIQFNQHIQSIKLPELNSQFKGTVAVSGWGTTVHNGTTTAKPMTVQVDINEREYCKRYYPYMSIHQFCTGKFGGGKGHCKGDSGGPIVKMSPDGANPLLVGIVSAGAICGHHPTLEINVSSYRMWIDFWMLRG